MPLDMVANVHNEMPLSIELGESDVQKLSLDDNTSM